MTSGSLRFVAAAMPARASARKPKVFASNFPGGDDRHMYSTTDGRVMYVTPLASARINALKLAQGEVFYICKRKDGRLTEYAVSREPLAAGPERTAAPRQPAPFKTNLPTRLYAPPAAREHEPPSELECQLMASIELVNRRKVGELGDGTLAIDAPPRPAVQAPPPVKPVESRIKEAQVAQASGRPKTKLEDALCTVVAAAYAAQEYARSIGYTSMPQFTSEDIRTMANTLVIQSEGGKRNAA